VREPGADAGLQEAKADASEECVAPEAAVQQYVLSARELRARSGLCILI